MLFRSVNGTNLRAKIVGQISSIDVDPNFKGLKYNTGDPVVIYGANFPNYGGKTFVVEGGTYSGSGDTTGGRLATYTYTINKTGGTSTITGIYLNATETSLTGTTHNLMDLQVGGVSKFKVTNAGYITSTNIETSSYGIFGGSVVVGNGTIIYYGSTGNGYLNYISANVWQFDNMQVRIKGNSTNDIQRWYKSDGTTLAAYVDMDGVLRSGGGWADTAGYTSTLQYATLKLYDGNTLIGITGGAGFKINSKLFVGGNTTPTALLHLAAGTTAAAQIRLTNGVAPTTPNDGDIWYDGTDLNMFIGGTTKQFKFL